MKHLPTKQDIIAIAEANDFETIVEIADALGYPVPQRVFYPATVTSNAISLFDMISKTIDPEAYGQSLYDL